MPLPLKTKDCVSLLQKMGAIRQKNLVHFLYFQSGRNAARKKCPYHTVEKVRRAFNYGHLDMKTDPPNLLFYLVGLHQDI